MPSVNDVHHQRLQEQVDYFLTENNYLVASATYHDVMPRPVVRRLQNLYTPDSMYIRSRADRIAIHKFAPICFHYEIKTGGFAGNVIAEAMPLGNHKRTRLRVLYVFHNPTDGFDGGFWVRTMPKIECIKIPDRWTNHPGTPTEYFEAEFQESFPGVRVDRMSHRGRGSGDPFAIWGEESRSKMFDWRQEVFAMTERATDRLKQRSKEVETAAASSSI